MDTIFEEFRLSIAVQTLSRELRKMAKSVRKMALSGVSPRAMFLQPLGPV